MTEKQLLFCKEYIIDFNATRAYKTIYNCDDDSARSQATRLLANVSVQAEINKELDKRIERVEVRQDRIIHELSKIAFSDIRDYVDINDNGVSVKVFDEIDTSVLNEITETSTSITNDKKGYEAVKRNVKIKLHDKLKAIELLGRHLKLFTDKIDLNGKITTNEMTIDEIEKRQQELIEKWQQEKK